MARGLDLACIHSSSYLIFTLSYCHSALFNPQPGLVSELVAELGLGPHLQWAFSLSFSGLDDSLAESIRYLEVWCYLHHLHGVSRGLMICFWH